MKTKSRKRSNNWKKRADQINKDNQLLDHTLVFTIFGAIGILIYWAIITYILPQNLPINDTTAINWLVLHKHSITLDYIRFFLFVFTIPMSISGGWVFFIWRKTR